MSSFTVIAESNTKSCSDAELLLVVFDVLMAGMETTVTTLKWALLFMIRNMKVSSKRYSKAHEGSCRCNNRRVRRLIMCSASVSRR